MIKLTLFSVKHFKYKPEIDLIRPINYQHCIFSINISWNGYTLLLTIPLLIVDTCDNLCYRVYDKEIIL